MGELKRKTSLSIHDARIAGLYDLEHTIGQGHFAVVKLAKHVFTGEKVSCFVDNIVFIQSTAVLAMKRVHD